MGLSSGIVSTWSLGRVFALLAVSEPVPVFSNLCFWALNTRFSNHTQEHTHKSCLCLQELRYERWHTDVRAIPCNVRKDAQGEKCFITKWEFAVWGQQGGTGKTLCSDRASVRESTKAKTIRCLAQLNNAERGFRRGQLTVLPDNNLQ